MNEHLVPAGPAPSDEVVVEACDIFRLVRRHAGAAGASVAVARGEILAIMGPSGSGKSTLLHCLAGILVPDQGRVLFAGRPIHGLGENERSTLRRDHFGFVFQFGQLVPELTAEENVALPLLLGGTKHAPRRWRKHGGGSTTWDSRGSAADAAASCRAGRRNGSPWPVGS